MRVKACVFSFLPVLAASVLALCLSEDRAAAQRGPAAGAGPGVGPGTGPGAVGRGAGARGLPAGAPARGGARGGADESGANEPRGIRVSTDKAQPGYTLFTPLTSDTTYLIDNKGEVVRTWKSDFVASSWVYMLDDGSVVRGATEPMTFGFSGGGQSGRFQKFNFDGKLVWDYVLNSDKQLSHHDVAVMPNGNILAIVWEGKTQEEGRKGGRRPDLVSDRGLWPDKLVELQPVGANDAKVVWEWHTWDHLIQNIDPKLDNYGDPSAHPEKIDINSDAAGRSAQAPRNAPTDLFHTNSVFYNAALDQVIVSTPNLNEVWVIDHSTTIQQAAGSTGGRSGKGGDLLYRWGNPQTYGRGTAADQRLGFEHDARWIPEGLQGSGHILIFNNRTPGPNGTFSQLIEI